MPVNGLKLVVANWQWGLYHVFTQQNGIEFAVADKVRTSQLFVFRLRLAQASDLSKTLKLSEEIGLVLGVESPRLARNLSFVDLEIPLPAQYHRPLPIRALARKGGLWVTLGQTAVGTPVHVNLAGNRTCHTLVSGMTGSGKTVAQHLIAWTLAMDNDPTAVNMILIDGKGATTWWGFEREAHLAHPVIGNLQEAIAALTWTVAEVDRRKQNGQRTPRLFVIVDEVRELLELGGELVAESIQRIAALGRELGIHIIVATQHALTDAIGGSIAKANLPLRLTGMVVNAGAAYVATGVKNSGAETLRGNGDFLITVAGASHRVQVALIGNREFGQLPRVEESPRLNFGDLDPVRVLDVTSQGREHQRKETDPEALAYALATGCGTKTLRKNFSPMGTNRARRLRDLATAVREAWDRMGCSYPVLGTDAG